MRRWVGLASLLLFLGAGMETRGQIPSSQRDREGLEGKNRELQQQVRERVIEEEILPAPSFYLKSIREVDEKTFDFAGIEGLELRGESLHPDTFLPFQAKDTLPPVIQHKPPPLFEKGGLLSALVSDPSGVQAVFLHYRPMGETLFETRELERGEGDQFQLRMEEVLLYDKGLEYYMTAFDEQENGPSYWANSSLPHRLTPATIEPEESSHRLWFPFFGFIIVGTILLFIRPTRR